jgi:hypothetical protein
VSNRSSKKQAILDCRAKYCPERAGVRELRLIQKVLHDRGQSSPLSYIASVLRQAGTAVEYEDRYVDPNLPEPYARRLEGALRFGDLAAAESSLRELDTAYREYRAAGDHTGSRLARRLVLRGKERAQSLAANLRVRPEKRQEKREIANWFRVWLESPALFFDWLAVRKQTQEFRQLFPLEGAVPPNDVEGKCSGR